MNSLNDIMLKEIEAIENLLHLLDKQYSYIVKNDIFSMESCVSEIEKGSRTLAESEVERRKVIGGRSMNEVIFNSNNSEIENNYRKIRRLLNQVVLQKDTNDLLLKQGLSFTNRMLNILNPDRSIKTYNSYGKILK